MSEAKPELTERELSYHVATVGVAAKHAASEAGGDPAQLRALVAAVKHGSADTPVRNDLKGFTLRSDDLLVTLCLNLHTVAFGFDPRSQLGSLVNQEPETRNQEQARSASRMQAIAVLGFIFTQAEDAWEMLDLATSAESSDEEKKYARRDFNRAAVEFGGSFKVDEIEILMTHLIRLARQHPPADDESPGKAQAPAP